MNTHQTMILRKTIDIERMANKTRRQTIYLYRQSIC